MNSTKKNSEFGGVKKKLTAAIAMLLVATIMMVSSTYAWFTLSTAPEVTGITTSVGANGNLEMALLNGNANDDTATDADNSKNTYKDMSRITSAVGDSIKELKDRNITWGNLVDLSDASYGLSEITLNPARLSLAAGTTEKINTTSILKTAKYGNDGRVVDISGTTLAAAGYIQNKGFTYNDTNPSYGVRAIGSSGNLTDQEAGLISAKGQFTNYMSAARNGMSTVLATNAQDLANAIIALAMGEQDMPEASKQAISKLVTGAETALGNIESAYKEVFKGIIASKITDAMEYEAAITEVGKKSLSELSTTYNDKLPSGFAEALTALTTQKEAVSAAKTALEGETPNYKDALSKLVDYKKVSVNGYDVTKNEERPDNALLDEKGNVNSSFVSTVVAQGGAIVEMPDKSGVFAYIGQAAGNYSAQTKVSITYKGIGTLNNINATLRTTATVNDTVKTALNNLTAAASKGTATYITDSFGYVLDFAFRTNAAGSSLQLATDGLQRIYNGTDDASQNVNTMGSGSTMTFKSAVNGGVKLLSAQQVTNLMKAIRVVFINPEDGTIYGVATLDDITVDANDTDAMTGKLSLKKATYDVDGKLTINDWSTEEINAKTNLKLVDLPQNTATKVSAVVYLDGDLVDNSMVANASKSITGSMNLQFASSETLVPMNYSPLKNGTANP